MGFKCLLPQACSIFSVLKLLATEMAKTDIGGKFYAKKKSLLYLPKIVSHLLTLSCLGLTQFFRTVLLGRVASAGAPGSLPWFIFGFVGKKAS